MSIKETTIIIGASHAAAEAITQLRRNGWQGMIKLIGDEDCLPYQKPPLSKSFFSGEIEEDKLTIKSAAVYDRADVELHLGVRVEKIDTATQTVLCNEGSTHEYSNLILATGARVRKLKIIGAENDCLHYLRSTADVKGIKEKLITAEHVLIIGGGYIGLEVAASSIKLGKKVTVLEAMDRILNRVTSPVVSEFYTDFHKNKGVDIKLQSKIISIAESDQGPIAVLQNGEKIPFDLAIAGIGVIPNIELASDAGIACDNGILVNEFMETDHPNIYAVGDCSNHPSEIYKQRIRLESVPSAVAQAKTAALHICDKPQAYNDVPWFWSDQYNIKLQSAGLSSGYDDYVVRGNINESEFAVFYLKNKKLIAVDAINSPREYMTVRKALKVDVYPNPEDLKNLEIPIKEILLLN